MPFNGPANFAIALVLSLCAAAAPATRPSISSIPQRNAMLGDPSDSRSDPRNKNNYLLIKSFFVLSYNSDKGTPNWVSWVLTETDLGDAERKRIFDSDTDLPLSLKRIKTSEYAGSGFDRGHVCPHGDRAANTEMSYSTFVMTNIIPQAPNLNQKAWNSLEEYERELARVGYNVYISAGPAGQGGVGKNGPAEKIGSGIVVPAKCWKILVLVKRDGGDDDLKKIDKDTRVIAVLMPNDNDEVDYEWAKYRVSVTDIEKETGLTFFSRLPRDVAAALKAKVDSDETPKPVPKKYGE